MPRSPYRSGDRVRSRQVVTSATQLLGEIDSNVEYFIDGNIDLGSGSIVVPEGGMQVSGLGFNISSITSSSTIFTSPQTYSGDLFASGVSFTSPAVFDLDNDGNGNGVECVDVNFLSCGSIGELTAYRQGLWSNVAVILCTNGVTLSGAWSGGFASLTSIVIGGMTGPLFKSGTSLSIAGTFRSDVNALQLSPATFSDISESEVINDASFSMEGVRVPGGYNAFTNMPSSSVKARFSNCQGVRNTYPGGQTTYTAEAVTNIAAQNTLYMLEGTTTASDLQWFSAPGDNNLTYISTQPIEVEVKAIVTLSGTNNDQVQIVIRQYDDSASSYIDLSSSGAATMNAGGRAEGISALAYASLSENDRIEVWVENLSSTNNVTAKIGGLIAVTER